MSKGKEESMTTNTGYKTLVSREKYALDGILRHSDGDRNNSHGLNESLDSKNTRSITKKSKTQGIVAGFVL